MKFATSRFGAIEFSEDVVLTFPEGVLGFPADRRYILLEHNSEGSPFRWLQSLENPDLAFIVVDPLLIEPRYQIDLDVDTARMIGTGDAEQCAIISIVNVPRERPIQMTANLKAPLVINAEARVGRQVIQGSSVYSISTAVFPAINHSLLGEGLNGRVVEVAEEPVLQKDIVSG